VRRERATGPSAAPNDERVAEFLQRPLSAEWPYVWLDATYLKVRQGGRIVSVAAIIAMAVNTNGRREIIGLGIGPSEAETFWTGFLRKLARRGLRGVKLVVSDAHEGLKAAIMKVLSATWQRCRVGLLKNTGAGAVQRLVMQRGGRESDRRLIRPRPIFSASSGRRRGGTGRGRRRAA
jgi:transposase-like protein